MTEESSSSCDILKYVICTNTESCLGEDDMSIQAGLVVADTSKQSIFFMKEEQVAMFKDIRTAAQYLRLDDGVKKCLVGHYLALQEDVFSLGQMSQADDTGYSLRVRTVGEVNDHLAGLGKISKMLEADAFWASRLLLEVTHDMLVDVASDVLEEKTVAELNPPVSQSVPSLSPSVADCLEEIVGDNSDECPDSDEQISLDKLLQVKKSIITQIEKLTSKVDSSPPRAYKRRNCDALEQQLESVSSEEVEWTPSPVKTITSLEIDPFFSSSQKNVSMVDKAKDKEAVDKVSSEDDYLDCVSHYVPKGVKNPQSGILSAKDASSRKRRRKRKKRQETKGERLIEAVFDDVSSDDYLDCQSHSVPKECSGVLSSIEVIQDGIHFTNEASSRKRKRRRKNKRKTVNDGLTEALDKVSSDDNLDDFYDPSLSEDGELVNLND